jgi:RNA polymerase sigma factor (sigma-70 family)
MPIDDNLTSVFVSIRSGLARAVSGIVPPKEIEDVVQETYVRVCQTHSSCEIRSPRSFMYRTARNIALNYVNKAESRLAFSLEDSSNVGQSTLHDPTGNTLDRMCTDEQFSFFCDAVRGLPTQCRRAFVLKKVYGHSYREIADTMQISEKTVEKHIAKGITRCRSYMLQRNDRQGINEDSIDRSGGRP